jgi:hypothetical protein
MELLKDHNLLVKYPQELRDVERVCNSTSGYISNLTMAIDAVSGTIRNPKKGPILPPPAGVSDSRDNGATGGAKVNLPILDKKLGVAGSAAVIAVISLVGFLCLVKLSILLQPIVHCVGNLFSLLLLRRNLQKKDFRDTTGHIPSILSTATIETVAVMQHGGGNAEILGGSIGVGGPTSRTRSYKISPK